MDCTTSAGNDRCFNEAAKGRSAPQADTSAKKYAECKSGSGKAFDDDTCGLLPGLNASALAKLAACIDKPCDQIDDCLDATRDAISPACAGN